MLLLNVKLRTTSVETCILHVRVPFPGSSCLTAENGDLSNITCTISISTDEYDNKILEVRSQLSTSFLLCTIAAGLGLFCIPLLIIDLCYKGPPSGDEMHLIHIEYLAQGL